ncbi:hypothetical protein N7537_000392 [Penicillium hordei]|uniref:Uncharacterized protein n=1 Tax=Penicillium hordei TaxID=40994 RepID=A0AAD6EDU2_9EURO|nr:uncharacterized protein N7537_000392 [Penicillium hordei]KAJ5615278.1 hypothetical protein N7537_000392 [Penicillium hordei]
MPRVRRPSSTRPSNPRYGICADDEARDTARHLSVMNKNAQLELAGYSKDHDLPYYDKIEFDSNGYLVLPPGDHRLSDALVFLIVGQNVAATRNRHGKWPADFDSAGDIYPRRWPMGHPVIVWAHGIPFIPVFADYYALVGSHLRKYLWLITTKTSHAKLKHEGWHLGEITVSPKKLHPPVDMSRILNVDFDAYDWSKFTPVPTFKCSTKRQVLVLQGATLTLTRPANIRGFHPNAGPSQNTVANRPNDVDDETWSTRRASPYRRTNAISLIDKRATTLVAITTWRHPLDPDPAGTRYQEGSPSVELIQPTATTTFNAVNPISPTSSAINQNLGSTTVSADPQGPADTNHGQHPATHLVVNDRDSPSESLSIRDNEPPQQSPSIASLTDGRKRKYETTKDDIRRMFGSFSADLVDDCDYIDAIADKLTTITDMETELDTPEAQRILRLNEEIVDNHQQYNGMISQITQRLALRDDWQRCILERALESAHGNYTNTYGATESDGDDVGDTYGLREYSQRAQLNS